MTEAHGRPIEARGLTKVYTDFWGRPRVLALDGLDLEVARGEIFGLLGPNGSGKTTSIKLFLGLLWPTRGEALVLGRRPDDVSAKQRIGYLPEESCFYHFLTGRETVDFYGRIFGLPRAERRRRTAELLEMVGLAAAADRRLGEYSKGMLRRAGLAQALVNDPELVILDEPTSGLDPVGCRQVKDLVLSLKAQGRTVLVSSHLLADMEDVCDRVAIVHNGKLKRVGRLDELLERADATDIRVRGLSEAARGEVQAEISRRGGEVLTVRHPRRTLEEYFLETIGAGQPTGGAAAEGGAREDRGA
ncbi:MAG TPA: ABC transporter ATP-binding protein [Planctomycetota bacterium]|nr:ABC transporter ATP-binding protein [Planctomycetota bacterium]